MGGGVGKAGGTLEAGGKEAVLVPNGSCCSIGGKGSLFEGVGTKTVLRTSRRPRRVPARRVGPACFVDVSRQME